MAVSFALQSDIFSWSVTTDTPAAQVTC